MTRHGTHADSRRRDPHPLAVSESVTAMLVLLLMLLPLMLRLQQQQQLLQQLMPE